MTTKFTTLNALIKTGVNASREECPPAKSTAVIRGKNGFQFYYTGAVYVARKEGEPVWFFSDERSKIDEFLEEIVKDAEAPLLVAADTTAPEINYCELTITGYVNATSTTVKEGVNRVEWERTNAGNLSVVNRPAEFNAGWDLVHYDKERKVFLGYKGDNAYVKCQLTGKRVALNATKMVTLGGESFTISKSESDRLGLVLIKNTVDECNTKFDIHSKSTPVDDEWVNNDYILDNPTLFATSFISGKMVYLPSSVVVATGQVVSKTEFLTHGFTCAVSQEKHLKSLNPRYGKIGVADAHYKPTLESVIRGYHDDPQDVFGHLDVNGNMSEGKIPKTIKSKKTGKTIPNKGQYYALEIEVVGPNTYASGGAVQDIMDAKLGICCSDGSLPKHGFEVKTPPQIGGCSNDRIELLGGIFNKYKIEGTKECGVHINVSRRSLTELQIDRMTSFIYKHGNAAFLECIAGRAKNSEFCKFHGSKHTHSSTKLTPETRVTPEGKSVNVYKKGSPDKYVALNLNKEYAIEFRLFAGTVDPSKLKMYQEFVQALVEFTSAGNYNFPLSYAPSEREFLEFVFDRKRPGRKLYPSLLKFLIEQGRIKALPVKKASL